MPAHANASVTLDYVEDGKGETVVLIHSSVSGNRQWRALVDALKAASMLGLRVGRLVLLEPNPFYLLKQNGRTEAYEEARALRDYVKKFGATGAWAKVAERFADHWLGDGSWGTMPEERRRAFAASVPPKLHECDALMDEETTTGRANGPEWLDNLLERGARRRAP